VVSALGNFVDVYDLGRQDELHGLASRPGVAGVHVLAPVARPPMTEEQRLRGADRDVGPVVLIAGDADVASHALLEPGAAQTTYRLDQSVTPSRSGSFSF
jgi:hypothetical protein